MISLTYLFWLVGAVLLIVSGMIVADRDHPKRFLSAAFWFLYAWVFLIGDRLPPTLVGAIVIAMALIAGFGGVTAAKAKELTPQERKTSVERLGNRLFMPALTIPAITVIGTLAAPYLKFGGVALLDPKNVTLVAFGIGCVVALGFACVLTRDSVGQSMRESRRLTESLGWAVVLPQMLGMLGLVFSDAGVGKAVAHLTTSYIDMDYRITAVIVYCVGMALFTVVMGNGFAAFPVMTGGVGVPVLYGVFHANPAVMVAVGMFSGYCGTLLTPMAANFNIVPAALLELPDKNGVIKAQIPTALTLLCCNVVLLYFLMQY